MPDGPYRRWGKRLVDLAVAVPALVAVSPVLVGASILIRLESRGSPVFRHERLGQGGSRFHVYKLRTMTDADHTEDRQTRVADPGVTRMGRFLRRSKLDELPQLLNVVRGEMSLVGPRPDVPIHLPQYDEAGHKRLVVRPGITGLAQVRGGTMLTWPQRWRWDARYAEQVTALGDLQILVKTLGVVVRGDESYLQVPEEVAPDSEARLGDSRQSDPATGGDPETSSRGDR